MNDSPKLLEEMRCLLHVDVRHAMEARPASIVDLLDKLKHDDLDFATLSMDEREMVINSAFVLIAESFYSEMRRRAEAKGN